MAPLNPIAVMSSDVTNCASQLLAPVNFVNQSICKRHHEEIAVRSGLQIGHNTEVPAEEQSFTFRNVELADIVSHSIGKAGIVDGDARAIGGQFEAEQVPALEEGARAAHEQIALIFGAERATPDEAYAGRCHFEFPAQFGIFMK